MATGKPTKQGSKKAASSASTAKKSGAAKAAKSKKPKRAKSKKEAAKDKCFVISPFGGWHDDYYTEIFCPAIRSAGLEAVRADDLFRSSNIVQDIWHFVLGARVLLADMTGKNPNVFYELGLAHAARKPVLLLTQSMDDVPFDLRALRVIKYDVEHPSWGKVLEESIKQGLGEMLDSPERSVLPTFLTEEPSGEPHISKDEARLLGLQQQIESLHSEMRASRFTPRADRLRAPEARDLIQSYVDEGLPTQVIMDRLAGLGPPRGWIAEEISRYKGSKRP